MKRFVIHLIAIVLIITTLSINFKEIELTSSAPVIINISNHTTGKHLTELTSIDLGILLIACSLMLV